MPIALALLPLISALAVPQAPTQGVATEALRAAEQARHIKKEAKPPAPQEVRPKAGKLWTEGQPVQPRPIAPPNIASLVRASMPGVVGIVATTAGSASRPDTGD